MRPIFILCLILLLPFQAVAKSGPSRCYFDDQRADYAELPDYYKMAAPFRDFVLNANTNGTVTTSAAAGPIHPVSVKGLHPRKFLQYEKQKYGINMGWTSNASAPTEQRVRKWTIVRRDGRATPLRYGDVVAIGWMRSKPYIRYKKRKWGINLVWSESPQFEWQVLGGPRGAVVRNRSNRVIIYNRKHRMPLLYIDRDYGGHIGWPDSKPFSVLPKGKIGWLPGEECKFYHAIDAVREIADN